MEEHVIHPKVGLSTEAVKESARKFLVEKLKEFMMIKYRKYTRVKFSLIFTPSEFCIAAYRDAGSKGFFAKCYIKSHKKSGNELKMNTNSDDIEICTKLSTLESMTEVFNIFGGQLHFSYDDACRTIRI
jgi:hypothetical protein